MNSMSLTVSGRLGNTPALRSSASGTKWVRFSLATSNSYRDQDGNWRESETTWFNCKAWGSFAVNIAQSLRKGDPVVAQGRLVLGTYNHADKSTGAMSERADVSLHLTHIGVDLVHSSTVNVKHANNGGRGASADFDLEPSTGLEREENELPSELVATIDGVEESALVEASASDVPF